MEVRMAVKIGKIELEFEGSNDLFSKTIDPMVKDLIAFGKQNVADSDDETKPDAKPKGGAEGRVSSMTVKSIAGKLNANSGTELVYAAIASLAVIKNRETFTRQEITDEMKSAVGYFKPTYRSNLSNYLDTLVKQGTIIETSKDTFALKDSGRPAMEQRLAG